MEIDIFRIFRFLLRKKKIIIRGILIGMGIAIIVALISPVRYKASCTIVPQIGESAMGNLSTMAMMAGISLEENTDVISPKVYPQIAKSVPFMKELLNTQITVNRFGESMSLLDYFADERFMNRSIMEKILKYTVGLPSIIMSFFKEENKNVSNVNQTDISTFSMREYICYKSISNVFAIKYTEKSGCLTISAEMPESEVAAQIAIRIQQLLQSYITAFRIERAKAKLDFIEQRFQEVSREFKSKQRERARFLDTNRGLSTALARTQSEQLTAEHDILFAVYTELARQREQASIAVKEETPIFTIVEPVTIPIEKSRPRRFLIVLLGSFLGGLGGIVWAGRKILKSN